MPCIFVLFIKIHINLAYSSIIKMTNIICVRIKTLINFRQCYIYFYTIFIIILEMIIYLIHATRVCYKMLYSCKIIVPIYDKYWFISIIIILSHQILPHQRFFVYGVGIIRIVISFVNRIWLTAYH